MEVESLPALDLRHSIFRKAHLLVEGPASPVAVEHPGCHSRVADAPKIIRGAGTMGYGMRGVGATTGVLLAILTVGRGDRNPLSDGPDQWAQELSTGTWALEAYEWNWYRGVLNGTEVTIEFSTEEVPTLRGTAGCNQYGARFTVTEDKLEIGPIGSTEMLCREPEGVMDQETRYLSALRSVVRLRIRDNGLQMYDASGRLVLAFSKN